MSWVFCDSMDCSEAPLSMGFSRQEFWSGLPFPSPGDLPNSGIEPASPAFAGEFFTAEPSPKPQCDGSRKRSLWEVIVPWGRNLTNGISALGGAEVKASACNVGDLSSIPGSGRSPGEGNGNPLQYSCLENPKDRGAWCATVHGSQRVGHDWATSLSFTLLEETNVSSFVPSNMWSRSKKTANQKAGSHQVVKEQKHSKTRRKSETPAGWAGINS